MVLRRKVKTAEIRLFKKQSVYEISNYNHRRQHLSPQPTTGQDRKLITNDYWPPPKTDYHCSTPKDAQTTGPEL